MNKPVADSLEPDTLPARSNGKHPGGRPTKYTPQILRNTAHYLANYQQNGHKVPTLAGLSLSIGIHKETVQKWLNDKDKEKFRVLCSKLMSTQEQALIDNGLDNTWNSNVTKLLLSKHGYTDKVENSGTSVNVTINRGSIEIETGGQVIELDTD